MTETRKHHIHLALMFAAYIFLHTTTLLLANRESNGYISAGLEVSLYYIHMTFMILGLSSFALIKRLAKGKAKPYTVCACRAVHGACDAAALCPFHKRNGILDKYVPVLFRYSVGKFVFQYSILEYRAEKPFP